MNVKYCTCGTVLLEGNVIHAVVLHCTLYMYYIVHVELYCWRVMQHTQLYYIVHVLHCTCETVLLEGNVTHADTLHCTCITLYMYYIVHCTCGTVLLEGNVTHAVVLYCTLYMYYIVHVLHCTCITLYMWNCTAGG